MLTVTFGQHFSKIFHFCLNDYKVEELLRLLALLAKLLQLLNFLTLSNFQNPAKPRHRPFEQSLFLFWPEIPLPRQWSSKQRPSSSSALQGLAQKSPFFCNSMFPPSFPEKTLPNGDIFVCFDCTSGYWQFSEHIELLGSKVDFVKKKKPLQ